MEKRKGGRCQRFLLLTVWVLGFAEIVWAQTAWTVNPALPVLNRAYEVDCDASGNVYVFGGSGDFSLQKYDPSGALQWIHFSPFGGSLHGFGDLYTDDLGDSYLTRNQAGFKRVTTNGATVFMDVINTACPVGFLTISSSCNPSKVAVGGLFSWGAGTNGVINHLDINGSNNLLAGNVGLSFSNSILAQTTGSDGNYYLVSETRLIAVNPNLGVLYYMGHGQPFGYGPSYAANWSMMQSMNIIDANATHIYFSNGATLQKRLTNTGALVASAPIPGGSASFFSWIWMQPNNGGVVLDACGNVYVGSTNAIHQFDANLNLLSSVPTPGAVYDVDLSPTGAVIAGGNGFVMSTDGFVACGPKTITCPVILPTSLGSFEGTCDEGRVQLEWTTEVTVEWDHFDVERSLDGLHWIQVGVVSDAATATDGGQFRYFEGMPEVPQDQGVFYRLQIVDGNGQSQCSAAIMVEACGERLPGVKVYPTVTDGPLKVVCDGNGVEGWSMELRNTAGQVVRVFKLPTAPGTRRHEISLAGLPGGCYFVVVRDGRERMVGAVTKVVLI